MDYQIISYAGPPVLGAFIGYLTNKVAIRMLFRPLNPWYFFGARIPMTPGVIPSKRHKLAENIGEMVGEHLLTSKDIAAALSEKRFQDHLHLLVDNRVDDVLSRDLGPVFTLVPTRFQAYFKIAIRTLKYRLQRGVVSYISSDDFNQMLTGVLDEHLESFGEKELNELVSSGDRQKLYNVIDSILTGLLQGKQLEDWLGRYLFNSLDKSAEDGKCIADHLPSTLLELLHASIRERTPSILQSLAGMLSEPEIRERLILTLRNGIESFVASLGPLAAMASSFMDMSVIEEKIREYLTEKEGDIASWLQNPEVQGKMSEVLAEQVDRYLNTPILELLEKTDKDKTQAICNETATQIIGALRSQGVSKALSDMLRQNLEFMVDDGRKSISDVATLFLPAGTGVILREKIQDEVISVMRSGAAKKIVGRVLNYMIDGLQKFPLGVLDDVIPAGVRKGITEYIVTTANNMLLDEVPGIIESLNIRQTVSDKVDSLDLMRLERLLLSIMEEQFKYINLFGALLGFVIGMLNLLVLQLG